MNLMFLTAATALIEYAVARKLRIAIIIVFLLMAIATTVVIMMQKPVTGNIGTIAGEETQTYAGQNKARSKESILKKLTIAGAVIMAVLAILYFVTMLEV